MGETNDIVVTRAVHDGLAEQYAFKPIEMPGPNCTAGNLSTMPECTSRGSLIELPRQTDKPLTGEKTMRKILGLLGLLLLGAVLLIGGGLLLSDSPMKTLESSPSATPINCHWPISGKTVRQALLQLPRQSGHARPQPGSPVRLFQGDRDGGAGVRQDGPWPPTSASRSVA